MKPENTMRAVSIRHIAETIFEQNMDIYEKVLALDIEEFCSIDVNDVQITHRCSDDEYPEFTVENKDYDAFQIWRTEQGVMSIKAYDAAYYPTTWDEIKGSENFNLEQIEGFAKMMDALREGFDGQM